MDKVNKCFSKVNILIIIEFIIVFIFQFYYLSLLTANIPLMDYWRYIHEIGEKVMNNNLSLLDFWTPSAGVHRNPLLYILLCINIKYFNYNVPLEINAGTVILCVNACFVYYIFRNIIKAEKPWNYKDQLLFLPILLSVLNINQWEILTEQFSLTFMFRIFIYNIIFINVDKYCKNDKKWIRSTLIINALIFVSILLLSQGYFPAFVGTIACILILNFILDFREYRYRYLYKYVSIFIVMLIAVGIYLNGISVNANNKGNMFNQIFDFIFKGDLIKSNLIMFAATILPTAYIQKYGLNLYLIIGCIVALIVIFSIFLYIKQKMYKKTYYPIMLILYAWFNIILISFARVTSFDLNYLATSRYVVETTMLLVGAFWILLYVYITKVNKYFNKVIVIIFVASIILFTNSRIDEVRTAPYRKIYSNNLISTMLNIENASNEEIDAFQAGNRQLVYNGISFLKKYNKGYFYSHKNWDDERVLMGSDTWPNIYDDGWVGKKCLINIKTKDKGIIIIKGYLVDWKNKGEKIDIYNNKKYYTTYSFDNNEFSIEIIGKANTNNVINIISNFEIIPQNTDKRELSYIITSVDSE